MLSFLVLAVMSMTFETEPRDTVLVRIHDVVPDLLTDVRYATSDNFTKRILYTSDTLYARRAMAEQLLVAQRDARSRGLQLKVYDAYRPLSIQRLMWSIIPDERYVADPAKGSRHNRGCALDLTLCDSTGVELEMGTGYDEFTERAAATWLGCDGLFHSKVILQSGLVVPDARHAPVLGV